MLLPLIALLAIAPTESPAAAAQPPTGEEAPAAQLEPAFLDFARAVEKGMNARDGDALDAHLDTEALFKKTIEGVKVRPDFAAGFKQGLQKGTVLGLGKKLVERFDDQSSFTLLRARTLKGVPRALFRTISGAGLNYLDLELSRDATGKVSVVDIYPYTAGEFFSETLRRSFLAAAAETNQGLVDRLMGKEQTYLKNLPRIQAMQQAFQAGKYEEVLRLYGELPASLKNDKTPLFFRLHAASRQSVQGDAYAQAIADYEKALPNDPSLDLVSIDGCLLRKDHAGALRAIDRVDRRARDPYLSVLRGNVMVDKGDSAEARRHYEAAITGEPSLLVAHWSLAGLALQEKQYRELGERLDAIEATGLVQLNDLESVAAYEGFVKSPEYKAWKKRRAAKKRP
ncbi:tetratricopeptide repeat protein [Pyxidicoccus parkwayensis]|uniref:Tetratricopeptide repeat protein n=1 Tax=Pyxidicoccus parkwayensis TaxID=2813578 RepID=A0ABX7NZS2_9BACT|nr:tetratricopeptide repeat protein [Pyxidicoccus parkwaysis]QSQ24435.1 tetratricopeptide repeat protein [Pyxidicoccus parkwaysis]